MKTSSIFWVANYCSGSISNESGQVKGSTQRFDDNHPPSRRLRSTFRDVENFADPRPQVGAPATGALRERCLARTKSQRATTTSAITKSSARVAAMNGCKKASTMPAMLSTSSPKLIAGLAAPSVVIVDAARADADEE